MNLRAVVVSLVAAGCVAAAGVGGYLAFRLNPPAGAAASVAAPETSATAAPADAPQAVTDVKVNPDPAPVERPAAIAPESAAVRPAPREETPRRMPPPAPRPSPAPAQPPVAASSPATVPPAVATPPATVDPPIAAPPPVADPPVPVDPPAPVRRLEELTVKENSVIGIRLDTPLSSETARVEDKITALVTRDVSVDGHVAIASGARLEGNVSSVDRGGKFKERARIGLRFHSIVLADNTRVPIKTETIFREGESPTGEATAKIGASAVVGAILGAVVGGKKGAAIGSAAGAAGGTGAVLATGRNDVTIAAGTPLTVRLTAPVTMIVERDQNPRW